MIFRRGVWDLPKGKLDPGETFEPAAVREVSEEVGVPPGSLRVVADLGATVHGYVWPRKEAFAVKTTHWYAMTTTAEAFEPEDGEGIEAVAWVPWAEAGRRVGFESLRAHHASVDEARHRRGSPRPPARVKTRPARMRPGPGAGSFAAVPSRPTRLDVAPPRPAPCFSLSLCRPRVPLPPVTIDLRRRAAAAPKHPVGTGQARTRAAPSRSATSAGCTDGTAFDSTRAGAPFHFLADEGHHWLPARHRRHGRVPGGAGPGVAPMKIGGRRDHHPAEPRLRRADEYRRRPQRRRDVLIPPCATLIFDVTSLDEAASAR